MGICQIIMLCWFALALGITLAKHGQPKEGRWSFGTAAIEFCFYLVLLYFGGFFG